MLHQLLHDAGGETRLVLRGLDARRRMGARERQGQPIYNAIENHRRAWAALGAANSVGELVAP